MAMSDTILIPAAFKYSYFPFPEPWSFILPFLSVMRFHFNTPCCVFLHSFYLAFSGPSQSGNSYQFSGMKNFFSSSGTPVKLEVGWNLPFSFFLKSPFKKMFSSQKISSLFFKISSFYLPNHMSTIQFLIFKNS